MTVETKKEPRKVLFLQCYGFAPSRLALLHYLGLINAPLHHKDTKFYNMATSIDFLEKMLLNPNIQAAMKTIKTTEGTLADDGYNYLFTSSPHNDLRFTDMSTHPRRFITANNITSSAAGAYQFLYKTWLELCKTYGFTDFEPHTQDLLCLANFDQIGVLMDVSKGYILRDDVLSKLSNQWASLPYSNAGQNPKTVEVVRNTYLAAGGSIG